MRENRTSSFGLKSALLIGLLLGASALACATPEPATPEYMCRLLLPDPPAPGPEVPPPHLEVGPYDFSSNPKLESRLRASPHQFFRFINGEFSLAVCRSLAFLPSPQVRLHGDAHVEQYAVTTLGRGLTDFDDAAVGPQAVDLVHFATSVVLVGHMKSFSEADIAAAIAAFFQGYEASLEGIPLPSSPPDFARRLEVPRPSPSAFVASASQAMSPVSDEEATWARAAFASYRETLENPPKAPFTDVKAVGGLKLGVGSALSKKYLLRLEGPTKSNDDDRFVELKSTSGKEAPPCTQLIRGGAAAARADEERRSGLTLALPAKVLPSEPYWIAEWLPVYAELKVDAVGDVKTLSAVAFEIGNNLGSEHQKPADGVLPNVSEEARKKAADPAFRRAIEKLAIEMAAETERAFREFSASKQAP